MDRIRVIIIDSDYTKAKDSILGESNSDFQCYFNISTDYIMHNHY